MARFNTGGEVQAGSGGAFLSPDKEKATTVWLLGGKERIRWIANQASCFVQNGKPCNASWASVGPDDPAHELGLKADGYVAWVPVAVKNGDGSFDVKLWQTNKTNHASVAEFEKEWDMDGLRMKIVFGVNKRWTVSALMPHKDGPSKEQLAELTAKIPDDETFGKLIGPDDANGVWELLMKRLNVSSRNAVRKAFGVASKAEGASDDIEVEDV